MRTKLKLPSGITYGMNSAGERVCTGSQMGRRDTLPASTHSKLRLQRLPFVDGCYDRWGAYWGSPGNVWLAWNNEGTMLFKRADSRAKAKAAIIDIYPQASFYR